MAASGYWLRLLGGLALVAATAACAPRAALYAVPPDQAPDQIRDVYFMTTRTVAPGGRLANTRSAGLGYGRVSVSIPPERAPGQIAFPRGGKPDARRHFLMSGGEGLASDADLRRGMRTALRRLPKGERTVFLYVHGFNNTFADGVFRTAQMAQDFEISGVAAHFSWPSAADALGYAYDYDSVLFSREGLVRAIRIATEVDAERTLIVAHSMGSLLVMEALKAMAQSGDPALDKISSVVLIAPDIDVAVFRQQMAAIPNPPQPMLILVSQNDRALRLSARVTRQRDRLGTLNRLEPLADLPVTILDVSEFSTGPLGHFNAGTSPELIAILARFGDLERTFRRDPSGRAGLLPGTLLTVRNTQELILGGGPGIVQGP